MAHHPKGPIRAPVVHAFNPKSSPSKQLSLGLQGPGRAGDCRLSLMGNTSRERQGGGLNVWTPWVSGHSSSWILGISDWRQQEAETPPGLLADPHHRPRVRRDNKRNSKWCRRLLGSLRQAEELCQDTAWASSIWAFFPWKIEKESSPRKAERKGPGSWHSSAFYSSM